MTFNAKTNWQYGETVTETDANRWEQGIKDVHQQMDPADDVAKTIPQGVGIVTADRKSMFRSITFTGRTLINLLGRDGNCEVVGRWAFNGSPIPTTSTTQKRYGEKSMKFNQSSGSGSVFIAQNIQLSAGKYYVAITEVFIESKTGPANAVMNIQQENLGSVVTGTNDSGATGSWRTMWVRFAGDQFTGNKMSFVIGASTGDTIAFYADGIRIYEISQTEYNAIDSMTAAQVAAKYPYVDDMKHINAVHVQNPGKNLLPPFSEIPLPTFGVVTEPYTLTLNAPSGLQFAQVAALKVIPNTDYTLSATHNGRLNVYGIQTTTSLVDKVSVQSVTFNSGNNTEVNIAYMNDETAGTFTFSNPMLNVGSTALPFEPQKPSYMFLPDVQAGSNVDGSVADWVYWDGNGKPRIIRRFMEMALDGSLDWNHSGNFTGYKWIRSPNNGIPSPIKNTGTIVKYDGKILGRVLQGVVPDTADQQVLLDSTDTNPNSLIITIANSDSGWNETYVPSVGEIKACMNGWRTFTQGQDPGTNLYDGIGVQMWVKRTANGLSTQVTSLPTTLADEGYTPYRLMYQLAQSVDEAVAHESTLMLHDGPNQVELGTGVVVGEAVNTAKGVSTYSFNNWNIGWESTRTKHKIGKGVSVYRNSEEDTRWTYVDVSTTGGYGGLIGSIPIANYDPTAAYSVTYLALDTYKIGLAPQSITGYVTPNIKEAVDDAVEAITGLQRDVSVLQNTKAERQPPQWIVPTLLNGWIDNNNYRTGYFKHNDVVYVEGIIYDGVTAPQTLLFILPVGFRPGEPLGRPVTSYDGSAAAPLGIILDIYPNGAVRIGGATSLNAKGYINFSFSFRSEQ